MSLTPIVFEWDGEHMVPLQRFAQRCDKEFVIGERYILNPHEARSHASHSHYFASIKSGWDSLPENIAARFPSPEALRKWALVKAGYADERTIVANNADEARKIGAVVRTLSEFAVIVIDDNIVRIFTAKSQSARAMPSKQEFQDSKQKVLDVIADLLEVKRSDLERWGGKSA